MHAFIFLCSSLYSPIVPRDTHSRRRICCSLGIIERFRPRDALCVLHNQLLAPSTPHATPPSPRPQSFARTLVSFTTSASRRPPSLPLELDFPSNRQNSPLVAPKSSCSDRPSRRPTRDAHHLAQAAAPYGSRRSQPSLVVLDSGSHRRVLKDSCCELVHSGHLVCFFRLVLTRCFGSPFYTFYFRLRPFPVTLAVPLPPSRPPSSTL